MSDSSRGSRTAWGGGSTAYGWGGYRPVYGGRRARKALAPLLDRIREYDSLRTGLERKGGRMSDIAALTAILNDPVPVDSHYGTVEVRLKDQEGVRRAVRNAGHDLHLSVRQCRTFMPVYYICRIRHDYWGEYSLIVEDLYMSPGYPIADPRFVRLMSFGHEAYFLRLSQFRAAVLALSQEERDGDEEADRLLYDVGRHVFQAAWHEDQSLAVMAAAHLGLPTFHQAVELLYLCLSGELCELRSALDARMLRFFEEVYPRPTLVTLLEALRGVEGAALNELPRRAGELYGRLMAGFSAFLASEVEWGARGLRMPVWKALYANCSRLPRVGEALKGNKGLRGACEALEEGARSVIDALLASRSEAVEAAGGSA